MPDEGGNQRGYQWPSVEVPPSSVVISGSASEEFARDRPSRRLGFRQGAWVRQGWGSGEGLGSGLEFTCRREG